MTPEARAAAAIEILDAHLAGSPAEKALTNWARASRYAGSRDRAAVRDLVFDAIRCRRSHAFLGGGASGRGLILGGIRAEGGDPDEVFTGGRFGPAPLSQAERREPPPLESQTEGVRLDLPDWLLEDLRESLGETLAEIAQILRQRAPVFLRVNLLKCDRPEAIAALLEDGVESRPHPLAETALDVTANARGLRSARAYREGLVELQDAASQAVVAALPAMGAGARVLDYCAGGGGKALALAAGGARVFAHDIDPRRMADLPSRAARAGATITLLETAALAGHGPFDMVFADAPCSGSGAWRRSPEEKWRLDRTRLDALRIAQRDVLDRAARLVAPGGILAYATCSLLRSENEEQAEAFVERQPGWIRGADLRLTPLDGGDGFFLATFARTALS